MSVALTEPCAEVLQWLAAFPDRARELAAANALLREDGSFVIGPASRLASGFLLRPKPEWPGWCAVATEVTASGINDDGPPIAGPDVVALPPNEKDPR